MAFLPNLKRIDTVTVGAGGSSSIQFNSIPQTYTDLYIVLSARGTRVYQFDSLQVRFNSDTGNNYTYQDLFMQNGAGAVAGNHTSRGIADRIYSVDVIPAANSTSNTFGTYTIHIPNYKSSNSKSLFIDAVGEANSTTIGDANRVLLSGLWNSSAAITSISLAAYSANLAQYSTATLYGVTSSGYGAKATGGIISEDSTYYYHTFNLSGTFTPTQSITADILVVAGGGGGGSPWGGAGGGGGAGGVLLHSAQSLTATGYSITVGSGGSVNTQGGLSQFASLTSATGGGRGGLGSTNGGNGGSGGGSTSAGSPGTGTVGQGNNGGTGLPGSEGGGGGGGAGGSGGNASGGFDATGGNGGIGTSTYSNWNVGENINGTYFIAGGGGGGAYTGYDASIRAGLGGRGGGGAGGGNGTNRDQAAISGISNTGGGGGGCGYYSAGLAGASGGSGVVVIRYAK